MTYFIAILGFSVILGLRWWISLFTLEIPDTIISSDTDIHKKKAAQSLRKHLQTDKF